MSRPSGDTTQTPKTPPVSSQPGAAISADRLAHALTLPCKLCGAEPGIDCTNLDGKPLPGRRIHHYRIEPKK